MTPPRSNPSANVSGAALSPAIAKTAITARENNTPVDSRGNDDDIAPVAEHDETANGEHSTDPMSEHGYTEDKPHKTPSGEENSPDEDAHIIPETHLEQENLRRRLIATGRSLKKQKQRQIGRAHV